MKVLKGNLLVKPEEKKKSALIMDETVDTYSRGTVMTPTEINEKDSWIEPIIKGTKVIFGEDYDVLDIDGEKYLVMDQHNVKLYFPETV